MTVELAVIIPTRGRPENVRRVIGAWDFTNAWDVADMVLVADADDPELEDYGILFEDHRHPDTGDPLFSLVVKDVWKPMVHKLNEVAYAAGLSRKYFAIGFAGDDHVPQTINWAQTYLAELHRLGTGMVYGDDGYQGVKLSTEWAVTADAVRELERMVPAPVEHMYCDNAIMELFSTAGALTHLPGVRIEHMHPIAGKAETDAQYQRVNSREQFSRDRDAYQLWRIRDLPRQIKIIKDLRPGAPVSRPERKEMTKRMNRSPFPHFFKQVKGVTPEEIGITLADFAARVPADQKIVELGVYHGKTALQMAWGARQGNGATVTGIDPWDLDGNPYGDEMGSMTSAHSWAQHWVRSLGYANHVHLVQNFSSDAAPLWEGPKIGLLFVDGDHDYAGARRDVEDWAPHLAPDAIIAIDDYGNENYPGVRMAVDDLVHEGVLAPVEVYHDRLAVTRLAERVEDGPAKYGAATITSEGVTPSPYPAAPGQVAVEEIPPSPGGHLVTGDMDQPAPVDTDVSDVDWVARRSKITISDAVQLGGYTVGTSIEEMPLAGLKALAKVRGIRLGARKDLRASIIQALKDGE